MTEIVFEILRWYVATSLFTTACMAVVMAGARTDVTLSHQVKVLCFNLAAPWYITPVFFTAFWRAFRHNRRPPGP